MSSLSSIIASLGLQGHIQSMMENTPAIRFFEPNARFFSFMSQFKGKFICDCGTGSGFVPHALRALGHDADGIDLYHREDGYPVTIKDATERHWRPTDFVLVCRPSHGGWATEVIENAIAAGAMVAYVGLTRNIGTDLTEELMRSIKCIVNHVGGDDEFIYCWGDGFDGVEMPSNALSVPDVDD